MEHSMGRHVDEADLLELCDLLHMSFNPEWKHGLNEKDFQAWKKLAEDSVANAGQAKALRAASLIEKIGHDVQDELCVAKALWISANIHFRLRLPKKALENFDRAESIYREHGEYLQAARMCLGKVFILCDLRKYQASLAIGNWVGSVLRTSQLEEDKRRWADLQYNLGVTYEQLGRNAEAIECFQYNLAWYETQQPVDDDVKFELSAARGAIGLSQMYLGQYAQSFKSFTIALSLLSDLQTSNRLNIELTRLYLLVARLEIFWQRSPTRVKAAYAKANEYRLRLDNDLAEREFVRAHFHEASWLVHIGEAPDKLPETLTRLRSICRTIGIMFDEALANLLLAQLELTRGEASKAERAFLEIALQAEERSEIWTAYTARLWQSRAARAQDDGQTSERALQIALSHIEHVQMQIRVDEYQVGYLEDKLIAYQELLLLHLNNHHFEKAFATVERMKSRALIQTLVSKQTNPAHELDVLDLQPLSQQLPDDTLSINYAIANNEVWAFLIGSKGQLCDPIWMGKAPSHAHWKEFLNRIPEIDDATEGYKIRLKQWYTQYVKPLTPFLGDYEHLLVIPDGILSLLPFACFFDETHNRYWIESHAITIAPSLSSWTLMKRTPNLRAQQRCLAVNFSPDDAPLKYASEEVKHFTTRLNQTEALSQNQATRDAFLRVAPTADLIYVAAHGRFHRDEPSKSYIRLADGPLYASEISQLNLQAPLVILSACETAQGHLTGNEKLGLIRAFLYAGAQSVIANHWRIEDEATFALMKNFTDSLITQKDVRPSIALANAQRAFISSADNKWVHPYFWAGPAVFGT